MNPQEKIQDLESKNIRLQVQHNDDIKLLSNALEALKKAEFIVSQYDRICIKLQELNSDTIKKWWETIKMLLRHFLLGILVWILVTITVQDLVKIFLN